MIDKHKIDKHMIDKHKIDKHKIDKHKISNGKMNIRNFKLILYCNCHRIQIQEFYYKNKI